MHDPSGRGPRAAGLLGCLVFLLVGWSGLLVPSLIRSLEQAFDQSDAGIGVYYFLFAFAYASGSLGGGVVTERLGRRTVLTLAAAMHAIGLIALGLAPSWAVFLVAAVPAGLGVGALDGGINGLFLDLFRSGRGRALNLVHLFFSLGALAAPLAVGRLIEGGQSWQVIVLTTGLAAFVAAAMFAVVGMPGGRHVRAEGERRGGFSGPALSQPARSRLPKPLLLLGVAIACYVAAEVGVSNWLVRFLEPEPLSVATTALALFWAGLAVGRLGSAALSDRFDHISYTSVAALGMALALVGAILIAPGSLSIALFALVGFAAGPVAPMIIAIGGERYPDRTAAVGGFLTSVAVAGAVIYPATMGFLSVTVGLTVAMLGNVVLTLACVGALILVRVDFGRPAVMLARSENQEAS